MKKPQNVLVALGWYDHRLLRGIAAYATEKRWHIASHSIIHEKVIPWGWRGDGVLAWLAAGDDLAQFVVSVKRPTVDFSLRREHLPFAHVVQDHAKTGQLVAQHFLERGLKHFCFYSDSENWSQQERGEAFSRSLAHRRLKCEWLRWHQQGEAGMAESEWLRRRAWLLKHLKAAPKPLGIFAANGSLAVEVRELCESAQIHVPSQIAIVGIDDYLLSVGAATKAISGVDTNLEEQGYQGAALLDRMMKGEKRPAKPVRIAPAGIHIRGSSDLMAVSHQGVVRALHHIADHYMDSLSVTDLARVAGMSQRGLHQAFCEHVGCTPGEKLRTQRMALAKKLLADSNEKVETIARRCGYPSLNTFFIAFRKAEKLTPAEYRRQSNRTS